MSDVDPTAPGPLADVRVVDLSSVIMGPYATQMLADLGADVIIVEDRRGDTNRSMGHAPAPELSGVSLNLLRNKRSVGLDLKAEAGREAFMRLIETADVLVTNLRPGPLSRLRLTDADVRAANPNLIVCQAHGFPSDSEKANAPAYDDIIQSAAGVGDLFARQGHEPSLMPTLVADKVCGLMIANAVTAALYHRSRTGEGQRIEVPMLDVTRAFVLVEHGAGAIPEPPLAPPGYQRILSKERRPQATADGWINVLPYTDDHYRALFRIGQREDLLDDPRIATRSSRIENSESLYRDIAAILAEATTEEWLARCEREGIPAARAASLDDLLADLPIEEHPTAGRYRVIPHPVRYSATPASVRRGAPSVGQDGEEVLKDLGYTDADCQQLRDEGILFTRS